jgi:hypothetical protein
VQRYGHGTKTNKTGVGSFLKTILKITGGTPFQYAHRNPLN